MKKTRFSKVIIHSSYDKMKHFILSIPTIFNTQGEEIYSSRNVIKSFQLPDGTAINVKRYGKPMFFNALIYSLGIRKPKGLRAYLYPFILQQKHIETPKAVAYIEERNLWGLITYTYFIYEPCPYSNKLYDWGWERDAEAHKKAEALAAFTAHMHNNEVLHKDFSPGNILWKKDELGYHFSVIDINRMSFGHVGIEEGCANFARLWAVTDVFKTLARAYARHRGFDEDTCETLVLKYRNRFWKRYSQKHDVVFSLD